MNKQIYSTETAWGAYNDAKKTLAKSNFLAYCNIVTDGGFEVTPFREAVASAFEGVAEGKCKKLLVIGYPRSGKTFLSRLFISWLTGKFPESNHIVSSYSIQLARYLAASILTQNNRELFDQNYQGRVLSVATCGSTCGYGYGDLSHGSDGVGVFLMDEPQRNVILELEGVRVKDWYRNQVVTRSMTKTAQVILATDFVGSFIPKLIEEDGVYDPETNPGGWHLVSQTYFQPN